MVEIIERSAAAKPAPSSAPKATPPAPKKLYVATPGYGCQVTKAYLASLLNLQSECIRRGVQCLCDFVGNESLVERARCIMAARFLKTDATHLLFIDADIAFRADTVFRLLDFDKDVVTAVYPKKSFNFEAVDRFLEARARGDPAAAQSQEPVQSVGLDYNINIAGATAQVTDGFVQVLDSATGFMMISRRCLEAMCDRYRDELYAVNDIASSGGVHVKDYVALFQCLVDPATRRFLSEDYSFCRRWQAMGGEIWADLASPLVHIGAHQWTADPRQVKARLLA